MRPVRRSTAAGAQTVAIQFQANGKGAWKTLQTVKSRRYFSVKQKFPGNGDVRLAYTYPKNDALLPIGLGGKKIVSRSPGDHGAMTPV